MAMIKSFTSLRQSKVLAGILPLESADMSWVSCDDGRQKYYQAENRKITLMYEKKHWIPCWSLAALLNLLPADKIITMGITIEDNKKIFSVGYMDKQRMYQAEKENMVDACYEIILKLKENKLI